MDVTLIEPYGFCGGVRNAIEIAHRARNEHPTATIYLIGALVHNENVISWLKNDGFRFIVGNDMEIMTQLKELEEGSVICFSAHGHPRKYDDIAKERRMTIYDATCPFVKRNEVGIAKALDGAKKVFYIGKRNHAEAVSALSIDEKNVILVDDNTDLSEYRDDDVIVFSQTTMSDGEIDRISERIDENVKKVRYEAKRCFDASERQNAMRSFVGNDIDLVVVLGSESSNNSKELYALAKRTYPSAKAYLRLSVHELPIDELKGCKHALLGSGASTQSESIEEAKSYLESLNTI